MLPRGRKRRVGVRSDDAIDPQLFGNFSKLSDVVAALGEFERGDEGEKRALLGVVARGRAGEARLFRKNHVDFGAGAVHFDAANGVDEIGGEIALRDHAEKRRLGSALESTTRARISVPSSRTTERTRPSRESICWTAALVRISAPKPRAALAMALVIEPMPPMTCP